MSFGFGVGDFVAVGTLIAKIVDTLRGAQSEYQELIRELESLQRALSQVDKLKGRGDQAIAIDQIKCAALTCEYPLKEFLVKIQKYEKSLGIGKSVTKIKDAGRKVQYAFGKKDEANTLRNYLNIHIGTINMLLNMLLVRQGLEMLEIASEQTVKNKEELRERIEDSSKELREVRGNVEAQSLAVRENNSIIQKLFWMVSGEIAAPLRSLSQTVTKVCVTTQQIYTIVLELKANVLGIDTRFTYFQAPVKVEDALGRVFPFPSECSIQALNAEIKTRFKEGPGKTEVSAGDYEIFDAQNTDQVLTITGRNLLLPGMSICMAIILEKEFAKGDKCPMPHCASRTFVEAVGGGNICSECKLWFDGPSKQRKREFKGKRISKRIKTLTDRTRNEARRPKTVHSDLSEASSLSSDEEIEEIEHSDFGETSISAFKRIRFDTGLGREELYEAAEAVLNSLKAIPEHSKPFLKPVNTREAPDYHQLIKRPMDLGTMIQKLKSFQYISKRQIVDDLDLIWRNCLRYYSNLNHPLRREALWMKKKANKLIVLIPDIVVKPSPEYLPPSEPSPSSNTSITHCHLCTAQFTGSLRDRLSNLKRHMRDTSKHGNFIGFPCMVPGCDAVISRSDNLVKHIRTVHEGETSTTLRRQGARKTRRDGDTAE